ncbi:MAG: hypothetical protein Ct9H300mP28_23270 [Pseudomonadota bacterium]|nr:MAG: hypothetical protein Ct9H300mP28_23270 [Pseudomonadota bacterium]
MLIVGGKNLMMQGKCCFDQPRNSCSSLGVTNLGFFASKGNMLIILKTCFLALPALKISLGLQIQLNLLRQSQFHELSRILCLEVPHLRLHKLFLGVFPDLRNGGDRSFEFSIT